MKKLDLSSTTIAYLVIITLAALAIIVAGILPSYRSISAIKQRIAEKQLEIERQEALFPLFMTLVKDVQKKIPEGFAVPKNDQVAPRELSQLENIFLQMAKYHHLRLKEVLPDTQSYLEESKLLKIELAFSGHFEDIRQLLYRICGWPYLVDIERLTLQPEESGILQLRLRIALRQHE